MAFITVDDRTGRQEIAVFADQFQENRDLLVKDSLVVVEGEVSIDNFSGGYKMRCMNVFSLEKARIKAAKFLKIRLAGQEMVESVLSDALVKLFEPHKDPQGCIVQIVYQYTGVDVLLKLGEEWKISPAQVLLDNLKLVSGIEYVELGY
jgi:DNA polymerase-3 subunit alpha